VAPTHGDSVTNLSDPESIERQIRALCDAGEREKAATRLLESYGQEIFRFLLSRLHEHDASSEVFSQFTEDLWRGLGGFRWECSARAWSYTLARHAASRYVADARRRRAHEEPLSRSSELHDVAQKVRTQTLAAVRTEVKSRVNELREQLPLDDQTLLILRVNRRLDWKEIARIMIEEGESTTERAIETEAARLRKRFQAVKEKLRQMASDAGLMNDEPGPSGK
jgi:RNA polymerase sigma-70 factor (ECF subfamily)